MTGFAGPHILMTTDAVGGVWQYATGLAAELAHAGYRITLAVIGPAPAAAWRQCVDGIEGIRLVETGLPLDWMCSNSAEVAAAASALARLADECGADLVHCNSPAVVGAAAFPVPVVAVAHGCIATWWPAARSGPLDPALAWHGQMMRRGLEAAEVAVAPSASFAATLQATYALSRRPRVVHNGRSPAAQGDSGAHRLEAALSVGRMWDPVKNAALLDAVAARSRLRFLAAGPLRGPHGEEARLTHMVALGTLPSADLANLLALRPIFVSAATFEPFGLAVLEAASAGCALVLSDIPTFRELWDGAAVFVDPRDADGFAAAIAGVEADPEHRETLGEAARARSLRYSPAATAEAMAVLYGNVLARREVAA